MARWTATTQSATTYEFDDEERTVTRTSQGGVVEVFTVLGCSQPAEGERLRMTALSPLGPKPLRIATTRVVRLEGAVPALV